MKRILIIEDDRMIADLLTEFLSSEGFEARRFLNPLEALEFIKHEPAYDLIFLDLMMPEMDGMGFRTEQLKVSDWSRVPVVVMSAAAHARKSAEEMNAAAVLSKPFELNEVFKIIQKYA